MLKNKTIAVVIPAYNEEKTIKTVIETIPDFVDRIVVVNDASKDNMANIVKDLIKGDTKPVTHISQKNIKKTLFNKADIVAEKKAKEEIKKFVPHEVWNKVKNKDRIILINHKENAIVGGAITTGYKWCMDRKIDCTAVMGGDIQMDPAELKKICLPIVNDEVNYVKGNRLSHRSAKYVIPKVRFLGNSILSLLTKIASGYWRITDTQTGYTAISLKALQSISLYKIYRKYGVPNDILVKLNIENIMIKEVDIRPVYHENQHTSMRVLNVIPKISLMLIKNFIKRLYIKYLFKQFHPLFLLYHLSLILIIIDIPFILELFSALRIGYAIETKNLIIFTFLTISAFQSLFFAMWMDMMDNERLQK